MVNVLFAGGGTTGHVAPMLSIAEDLRFQDPDSDILMLGTDEGLEKRLVPQAGYRLQTIPKVPFPRGLSPKILTFPFQFTSSIRQVRRLLKKQKTDVVVGVGGYVCPPAYLAAKSLGIPIVLHEANAVPGMANKLGARYAEASNIGFTFASTPMAGEQVGMPMRIEIAQVDRSDRQQRAQAAERLGINPDMTTLVVTGGSSGAQKINEAFVQTAAEFTGIQVLHITGAGKADELREAAKDSPDYHVVEYVDGMENAYAAADLIVCRSGAGTVAEVTVAEVPAVYVPLAIGNGEQKRNAADSVAAGASILIDNADFTADSVRSTVLPLLRNPEQLEKMSAAARGLEFPVNADRAMTKKICAAAGIAHPGREYPPARQTRRERGTKES